MTTTRAAIEQATYGDLIKFLGATTATLLCRTVWKDGIDIEKPDAGLQQLIDHFVNKAVADHDAEKKALEDELVRVREALQDMLRLADAEGWEGFPKAHAALSPTTTNKKES